MIYIYRIIYIEELFRGLMLTIRDDIVRTLTFLLVIS